MLELYPQIRAAHIAAISASGLWLLIRTLALLAAMSWPQSLAARAVGWAIDAAILTAAAMLLTILPAALFANGWLVMKLVLVAGYFGLAYRSRRRSSSRIDRTASLIAALSCYALIYGIARAHDPFGWFAWLVSKPPE